MLANILVTNRIKVFVSDNRSIWYNISISGEASRWRLKGNTMIRILLPSHKSLQKSQRKGFPLDQPISLMGPTGAKVYNSNHVEGTFADYKTAQKIKHDLIHKAKLKKSYAKIKEREFQDDTKASTTAPLTKEDEPATLDLHPERQAMLDEPEVQPPPQHTERVETQRHRRSKQPKPVPFEKEARLAQQRREEAEMRRRAFEDSRVERQQKIQERERFRKAMAKARTCGKNGQRKLGRESKVLLEKVKRVMGE